MSSIPTPRPARTIHVRRIGPADPSRCLPHPWREHVIAAQLDGISRIQTPSRAFTVYPGQALSIAATDAVAARADRSDARIVGLAIDGRWIRDHVAAGSPAGDSTPMPSGIAHGAVLQLLQLAERHTAEQLQDALLQLLDQAARAPWARPQPPKASPASRLDAYLKTVLVEEPDPDVADVHLGTRLASAEALCQSTWGTDLQGRVEQLRAEHARLSLVRGQSRSEAATAAGFRSAAALDAALHRQFRCGAECIEQVSRGIPSLEARNGGDAGRAER